MRDSDKARAVCRSYREGAIEKGELLCRAESEKDVRGMLEGCGCGKCACARDALWVVGDGEMKDEKAGAGMDGRCNTCQFWDGPYIKVDHSHCRHVMNDWKATSKSGDKEYDTCVYYRGRAALVAKEA